MSLGMSDDVDLDWDQSPGPPSGWPRYDGPCSVVPVTSCQCHVRCLMSVPWGRVRRQRPMYSGLGAIQALCHIRTRVSPHIQLFPVSRGGAHLQDCHSLLILSRLQRHKAGPAPPLPFQVFTGHRKGKGDALWLCSQVSDWLKVPSEASDWLIMTPCLLWAPNMGLANYLVLPHITPSLITMISP